MKLNTNIIAGFVIAGIAFASCSDDDTSNQGGDDTVEVTVSDYAANYSAIARANYGDALQDAKDLQTAILAFTAAPSETLFEAAKDAWLTARESYGTTEAFRLSDGPIDADGSDGEEGPEGLLNSWPMDESFVDYVDGDATAGFINDVAQTIDIETLADGNGGGTDETEVFVGYHTIEFLLWGQDNPDTSDKLPGQRAYTDYTTADNADRRGEYLEEVTAYLITNLEYVLNEWAEGDNYDAIFTALSDDVILENVIGGLAKFTRGELGGERIAPAIALVGGSQEDEHSCFSDNTHRDIALNFDGVYNLYYGTYGTISDASLADLVEQADATVAADVDAAFETAKTAVTAATTGGNIPFDYAISQPTGSTEYENVEEAFNTLQDLGDQLVNAASALGVSITAELPE